MGEKRAPVQGYSAGIPWDMHLRAYDAYRKRYGPQKSLIDLEGRNCRGGFHTDELDEFIPGWREELAVVTQLRSVGDRLAYAVAKAVMRGEYGSRSSVADALLDYLNVGGIGGPKTVLEWIEQYERAAKSPPDQ